MKLVLLLLVAALAWRLATGRWPLSRVLEPGRKDTRSRAVSHARVLLGVNPGASRQQIIEAHRQLVATVHPDRGGTSELVHEANQARDLLLGEAAARNTEQP